MGVVCVDHAWTATQIRILRCNVTHILSFRTIGGTVAIYVALIAIDHSSILTVLPCNAL